MITLEQQKYMISNCPSCNSELEFDGVYLKCVNPNCNSRLISKLAGGLRIFEIENVGGATVEKLYSAGIKTILDVFNPIKFNESALINSGEFKKGRSLDIIIEAVNKHLPFTFTRIIDSLMFDNTGTTISKQIAKLFEGGTPDWSNMSKAAYEPFLNPSSYEFLTVMEFAEMINVFGGKIEIEKKIDTSNLIPVVLTGSPKEFGYKTKGEFMKANPKFTEVDKLKDAKYLVTDDLSSTSSKMTNAKKLGVETITYDELKTK